MPIKIEKQSHMEHKYLRGSALGLRPPGSVESFTKKTSENTIVAEKHSQNPVNPNTPKKISLTNNKVQYLRVLLSRIGVFNFLWGVGILRC